MISTDPYEGKPRSIATGIPPQRILHETHPRPFPTDTALEAPSPRSKAGGRCHRNRRSPRYPAATVQVLYSSTRQKFRYPGRCSTDKIRNFRVCRKLELLPSVTENVSCKIVAR
eukprot:3407022-Rhodomonas_salina.1